MKKLITATLLVVIGVGMSGCIVSPAALTPSTVPVTEVEYTVLGTVDGYAWGAMILVVPVGETKQAKTARDRAIATREGTDGLLNVSMSHTAYLLGPVTLARTHVHGEAFQFNEGVWKRGFKEQAVQPKYLSLRQVRTIPI